MQNIHFNSGAVSAGDCISDGWNLIKRNYGMYLGIGFVAMILISCLPCVSLFLVGPVMCGVYYVYLREISDEPVDFGMMFKGFDNFVPAMVVGIIAAIPEIAGQFVQMFADLTRLGINTRGGTPGEILDSIGTGVLIGLGILGIIAFVLTLSLKICLTFAFQLIAEHKLGALDAIKLSAQASWANLGGLITLFIIELLIWIGGALLCIVGLFFISMPLIYAANAYAYRQVFPVAREKTRETPPTPSEYDGNFGSFGTGR